MNDADVEDFKLNDKGYWLLAMLLCANMTEEQKEKIKEELLNDQNRQVMFSGYCEICKYSELKETLDPCNEIISPQICPKCQTEFDAIIMPNVHIYEDTLGME